MRQPGARGSPKVQCGRQACSLREKQPACNDGQMASRRAGGRRVLYDGAVERSPGHMCVPRVLFWTRGFCPEALKSVVIRLVLGSDRRPLPYAVRDAVNERQKTSTAGHERFSPESGPRGAFEVVTGPGGVPLEPPMCWRSIGAPPGP